MIATKTAIPEQRKKLSEVKRACEVANVSLPQEVEEFFRKYPPVETNICAQHGYEFQQIVSEIQEEYIQIFIPLGEIKDILDKNFDYIVVHVKNLPQ